MVAPREVGGGYIDATEFWPLIERIARLEADRRALLEAGRELVQYATADIGLLSEEIVSGPIAKMSGAIAQAEKP